MCLSLISPASLCWKVERGSCDEVTKKKNHRILFSWVNSVVEIVLIIIKLVCSVTAFYVCFHLSFTSSSYPSYLHEENVLRWYSFACCPDSPFLPSLIPSIFCQLITILSKRVFSTYFWQFFFNLNQMQSGQKEIIQLWNISLFFNNVATL